MKWMFDTAHLADIRAFGAIYPYAAVTTNPTILKAEGPVDYFAHFRAIRALAGPQRGLHMQVVAPDRAGMVAEAEAILERVDSGVCIKVPVNEEGLAAMQTLKQKGVRVTATVIYSRLQGELAVACGADYIAPYFNRMENMDIPAQRVVEDLANLIARTGASTQIITASFKNVAQVHAAIAAGTNAVTLPPHLLREAFLQAAPQKAVADFTADWRSLYGDSGILDLARADRGE